MGEFAPQSRNVIDDLIGGKPVSADNMTLGPFDGNTITLLRVFVDYYDTLQASKGESQAVLLRKLFTLASQPAPQTIPSAESTSQALAPVSLIRPAGPARWRLLRLWFRSFRGVAPLGQDFEFDLNGISNLIVGPNGSGKSSLLGGVAWVISGQPFTDAEEPVDSVEISEFGVSNSRPSKVRDWPVMATLPDDANCRTAVADCSVEMHLQSSDHIQNYYLRRTASNQLESSPDRKIWTNCSDLASLGIAPLDIQLSITAPTVFGRRSLQSAKNARSILSLILGYDDLEALGNLATNVSSSRTKLANSETRAIYDETEKLTLALANSTQGLADGTPVKHDLEILASKTPTLAEIADVGKNVAAAVESAEFSLAKLLGLAIDAANPPKGIADRITVALTSLERGVWHNFPSLAALQLESQFPADGQASCSENFDLFLESFSSFVADATRRIQDRHSWWKKQKTSTPKLDLLLRAAQLYDEATDLCPVCERSLGDLSVGTELRELKQIDPQVAKDLADFFRELDQDLRHTVPVSLLTIADQSPRERLLADWREVLETLLGSDFQTFTETHNTAINTLAESLPGAANAPESVIPEGADSEFSAAAQNFARQVASVQRGVEFMKWGVSHLTATETRVAFVVSKGESEASPSILESLSKGKQAAANVAPLKSTHAALQSAYKLRKRIGELENQLGVLEALKNPLDQLKRLRDYAVRQVDAVFVAIRDNTISNWSKLYPKPATALKPGRLSLGKGRDKSIDSFLSFGKYSVSSQHFANAGLQRAIALSFYFALLERHPNGLDFIIMDDPILSLDDEHRERWARELVSPLIARTQFILATHQPQFLLNSGHHFKDSQIVELNPRDWPKAISWRPGDRVRKAKEELATNWSGVPNTLRKYREEILITLDSYATTSFFDPKNLGGSFQRDADFTSPHPLSGKAQVKIVGSFRNPVVERVLDPGSHALTEADLTPPMVEDCLTELSKIDGVFREELRRLELVRGHRTKGSAIPGPLIPFPKFQNDVSWNSNIPISVIGRAAAKAEDRVIQESSDPTVANLSPGGAVLVAAATLEPVAMPGQWVLLGEESESIAEGDLVAVCDADDHHYLRRIWSSGEDWILQAVNPVQPIAAITCKKTNSSVRKVIGVLYEPKVPPAAQPHAGIQEWRHDGRFKPAAIGRLNAVVVEGDSLNPIARGGQHVLVDPRQPISPPSSGGIAAISSDDENIGNVIKRLFVSDSGWLLVSPNPVDAIAPLRLSREHVRTIWPVVGVLFEARSQ